MTVSNARGKRAGNVACIEALEGRRLLSISAPTLFSATVEDLPTASVAASAASQTWTWQAAAPSPIARFESAAETLGGKLYVFGGFINTLVQATTRSDAYDPATNAWTRIADMPEPLTHTGHAVVGNTIWFAGGFVGNEGNHVSQATADVWKYNTLTNTWSAAPSLPVPRGAGALALVGSTLHFFGGLTSTRPTVDQGEHWTLDTNGGTKWIPAPAMPVPTNHFAGVSFGGKIYAIGGQHLWNNADNANINTVQVFDPAANKWSFSAALPSGRGHIADSTFVMNGQIIAVGGASDNVPALRDVLDYNPLSNSWSLIALIPQGRRAPVARAINGKLIVSTGDPGDVSATSQTWIGTLVTNSPWSTGPSLPIALGEVSGGIIGNKMYIVGKGSADTLVFNLQTKTWAAPTAAARPPYAGAAQSPVTLNGKLYLIGGIGGGSEGKLQIYDPITNTWKIGPSVPDPFTAGASSAVVIGGKIYVMGGIIGSSSSRRLDRFDPATGLWSVLQAMPNVLNHAAASTDGKLLYVFGGRASVGLANGVNTVEVYNPATNTWTSSATPGSTIPPLPAARSAMGQAIFWGGEFYLFGGETLNGAGSIDGAYSRVDIYNPVTHKWRSGPAIPLAMGGIFPLLYGNTVLIAGGGSNSNAYQSKAMEIYMLGG